MAEMLRNRHRVEVQPASRGIRLPNGENGVSVSTEPAESSTTNSSNSQLPPTSSVSLVSENGVNNNHGERSEDGEELMSSVVIEPIELDQPEIPMELAQTEHSETSVDEERGSISQDDGMMSSAATSTSSSVTSVGHRQAIVQHVAPIEAPVAVAMAVDQPEVADFLDMDFDVEPTSTDDDEEDVDVDVVGNSSRATNSNIGRVSSRLPPIEFCCSVVASSSRREPDQDCHFSLPSTSSYSRDLSATPKNAPLVSPDESLCVQGCRACNCDRVFGRKSDKKSNPTASTSRKSPVLGDLHLPSVSTAAASASSLETSSSPYLQHSVDFGNTNRQFLHRRFRTTLQQSGMASRLRCSHASVTIGGPSGLRLAHSAYVGFPTTSRPGTGFSMEPGSLSTDSSTFRIWTIDEASSIQATQIGPSACGATALVNVLRALGRHDSSLNQISIEDVERVVPTRPRANDAPVAQYLLSRSVAGTDAEDLIEAASAVTRARVMGRMFPMTETTVTTPTQEIQFGQWLLDWLRQGAIPVLTLNMQRGLLPTEPMPDAWHHQMVFGVCMRTGGVYLTNPLECVPLWFLKHALCSPSVLLVKAEEVRERWHGRPADLTALAATATVDNSSDSRPVQPHLWTEMNVIGQVAQVLRQGRSMNRPGGQAEPMLSHFAIPARYRSGVTLYALADSETWNAICHHPSIEDALALAYSFQCTNPTSNRAERRDTEDDASSSVTIIHEPFQQQLTSAQHHSGDSEFSEDFSSEADIFETLSRQVSGEHSHTCKLM